MKKLVMALSVVLLFGTFASCRDRGLDPATVMIGYVGAAGASADEAETIVAALEAELDGRTVTLAAYADEAALLAAIAAGDVHVAVLSARAYAELTTETPAAFTAILSNIRPALAVETLPAAAQLAAMNVDTYRPVTAEAMGVGHYGLVIVRRADYDATGTARIAGIADLEGRTVCTQLPTSAAGYVYPAVLLDDAGLAPVTHDAGTGEVEFVRAAGSGFPGAILGLVEGVCDAAFIYQDARGIVSVLAELPDVFSRTRVIAMTAMIHESLIAVDADLNAELTADIRAAFQKLAATAAGSAALGLFDQRGYFAVTDAEYEDERRVYAYVKNHLS